MAEVKSEVRMVPVSEITNYNIKLRDVERESAEYQQLKESILEDGIHNAVLLTTTQDHPGFKYILVDGLHRYSAAVDVGLEEIPAVIKEGMNKNSILVAQLVANSHKIDTKPAQMAAQLLRISYENPLMTPNELAKIVHRSAAFVSQYLKLNSIEDKEILDQIDAGNIKVGNAHILAALARESGDSAAEELQAFKERAIILEPKEFTPLVEERIKAIRAAKRSGKGTSAVEFKMIPRPRPTKVLKTMYECPAEAMRVVGDVSTPEEAVMALVAWLVRCDPESEAEAREKFEADKSARLAAREAKSVDKAKEAFEKARSTYEALLAEEASEGAGEEA